MDWWPYLEQSLGLRADPRELDALQVVLRAVVVFVATLVMVRLADKRAFAKKTAFDLILALVLASALSRTINGSAPLFPTIAAGFVLVLLHRFLAWTACRWSGFGTLIKGHSDVLIEDGRVVEGGMRRNHLSHEDLCEDLRLKAETDDIGRVKLARIERCGDLSVVLREKSEE